MRKTSLRARRTTGNATDSPTAAVHEPNATTWPPSDPQGSVVTQGTPNGQTFGVPRKQLEVHEHSFVSGPRSGGHYENNAWHTGTFSHSHEGGDVRHEHPHTGPASYTIDKDDWARATGLRGGGRKKFTAKPSGEQMPIVQLGAADASFQVIVCDPSPDQRGDGPGMALPMRLMKQFKMTAQFVDGRKRRA